MNVAHMRNIGAWLKSVFAFPLTTAVAAGAGDATEVDGSAIDRLTLGALALSAKLVVVCQATLESGGTLSFIGNIQDSPTGTDQWSDFGTALASTVALTGGPGITEEEGTVELNINLSGAKQFVRSQVTPDLSATSTDTAEFSGVMVFGGADELPYG